MFGFLGNFGGECLFGAGLKGRLVMGVWGMRGGQRLKRRRDMVGEFGVDWFKF